MKKTIISLCLITVLSVFLNIPPAEAASGDLLLNQKLDADVEGASLLRYGWTLRGPAQKLLIAKNPDGEGTCALAEKAEGNDPLYVSHTIGAGISGSVSCEFEIFITDDRYRQFSFIGDTEAGGANLPVVFAFNTGGIVANDRMMTYYKYPKNKWLTVKLIADTDEDCWSAYLEGELIVDKMPFAGNVKYRRITGVRFASSQAKAPIYFKNVKAMSLAASIKDMDTKEQYSVLDGRIYVDELGAYPNDDIDDSEAINRAVRIAALNKDTTVIFSEGTYIIEDSVSTIIPNHIFAIGADNITLKGNNTNILLGNPFIAGLRFVSSQNITVEGLNFDYITPPWMQGYVKSVDIENGKFEYEALAGYDIFDDPRYVHGGDSFGTVMNKENPRLWKQNATNYFQISGYEIKGDGLYEVSPTEGWCRDMLTSRRIAVGDPIVLNDRGGSIFDVRGCAAVTIKNCNVYSSKGCIVIGSYMEDYLTLDGVNALYKPDSDRWVTSNADGIHIQGLRGPATITNCVMEGLADDSMNLYLRPAAISKVISSTKLEIFHESKLPRQGDTIVIMDVKQGNLRAKSKITSMEPIANMDPFHYALVTLDAAIEGITPGMDTKNFDGLYSEEMDFPNSLIKNNTFRTSRRYGLLLRIHDSIIEGNTFDRLAGPAFAFVNEPIYPEGPGNHDLIVRNNIIDTVSYIDDYYNSKNGAAMFLSPHKAPTADSDGQNINDNILFEGNIIKNPPRYSINLSGSQNITFKDNIIEASDSGREGNAVGMLISNSSNIEISGGSITDNRKSLTTAFEIATFCYNVNISDVETNIPEGAQFITDNSKIEADIFAKKTAKAIKPDGRFDDWEQENLFELNTIDSVRGFSNITWNESDLSAKGKLTWDDDNLYIGVIVTDNIHSQNNTADMMWRADCIQIGLEPLRTAKKLDRKGCIELAFGLSDDKSLLQTSYSNLIGKPAGITGFDFAVERDNGSKTTSYEIAVPWSYIQPDGRKMQSGELIGFSLLVNDSDGSGRKGWLEEFSGIGSVKDPGLYGNLQLSE